MAERFTRPYVDAFFAVAGSADVADAQLPALAAVAQAIDTNPDLAKVLANPGI